MNLKRQLRNNYWNKFILTRNQNRIKIVPTNNIFLDISDDVEPYFDPKRLEWNFDDLKIKSYGKTNTFLVNYYGPPSGYKIPGRDDLKPWGTFPRFSLSQILDTQDYDLPEDIDWMSQFIPGEIPDWISALESESEKKEMMEMMGIGQDFDIKESPFFDQIIVLGENQKFVAALIVPDFEHLSSWCRIKDIDYTTNDKMITSKPIQNRIKKEIDCFNKQFGDTEKINLAINLTRITFPFLMLISNSSITAIISLSVTLT